MFVLKRQTHCAFALLIALAGSSLAFAQQGNDLNRLGTWDPVTGWSDGNTSVRAQSGSSLGTKGASIWSGYHGADPDPNSIPVATMGGISFTGDGRRCGGLFRSGKC